MDKIQELLMDTRNLDILSYDKYKKSSIKEKLEKIKLLNEYYKILYSNINKLDITDSLFFNHQDPKMVEWFDKTVKERRNNEDCRKDKKSW